MSKILVLGADGFLGNRFFDFQQKKFKLLGTSRKKLPFESSSFVYFEAADFNSISEILETFRPRIVLNCIATNVDSCELNAQNCNLVNTIFPSHLASYTYKLGIKLIHLSTDHYQSDLNEPRTEFTKVRAVNNYGRSKLDAELLIKKENRDALIIRTNFFGYELGNKNMMLLSNIKYKLDSGLNFIGFTDSIFSPVSVNVLILLIYRLIEIDAKGIINISSNEAVSKLRFAQLVAAGLNLPVERIKPQSISSAGLFSKRPNYLALDNSLLKEILNVEMTSLDAMIIDELKLFSS